MDPAYEHKKTLQSCNSSSKISKGQYKNKHQQHLLALLFTNLQFGHSENIWSISHV